MNNLARVESQLNFVPDGNFFKKATEETAICLDHINDKRKNHLEPLWLPIASICVQFVYYITFMLRWIIHSEL